MANSSQFLKVILIIYFIRCYANALTRSNEYVQIKDSTQTWDSGVAIPCAIQCLIYNEPCIGISVEKNAAYPCHLHMKNTATTEYLSNYTGSARFVTWLKPGK